MFFMKLVINWMLITVQKFSKIDKMLITKYNPVFGGYSPYLLDMYQNQS